MFRFFFSSRRRHTRCSRDWSSDVCSSDLLRLFIADAGLAAFIAISLVDRRMAMQAGARLLELLDALRLRSEERRVGKYCIEESLPMNTKQQSPEAGANTVTSTNAPTTHDI